MLSYNVTCGVCLQYLQRSVCGWSADAVFVSVELLSLALAAPQMKKINLQAA